VGEQKGWEDPNGQSTPWIFLSTEFVWLVTFFVMREETKQAKTLRGME